MARDDFPRAVVDILAKRVGVRCSNPLCRKLTTGPRSEEARIVNIGVAAHVTAASVGGPRYDTSLTSEQRQSIENGIWLCQNCAKLIDNDPNRYTIELLRRWRKDAEGATLAEIEGIRESPLRDGFAELELSWKRRKGCSSDHHDYDLSVFLSNLGSAPLGPYHIDLEFPSRVVHQPHNYVSYVADRSNADIALFRLIPKRGRPEETIYPGDRKAVMKIAYFMTTPLYFNHDPLFLLPVRATLYQEGVRPVTVIGTFSEFQNF